MLAPITEYIAVDPISPDDPTSAAAVDALREYASIPLFRSARFEELVIDDNPYRRPIRPEDLEWLRFDKPLTGMTAARLSGLLGHRMLLSIYDSRRPLLPQTMDDAKWRDKESFYSAEVMRCGERIRPLLEHHVFGYAWAAGAPAASIAAQGTQGIHQVLRTVADTVGRQSAELQELRRGALNLDRVDRTLAIQFVGRRLAAPLRLTATMLEEQGAPVPVLPTQSFTAGMTVGQAARVDMFLRVLAERQGVGWSPHRHFQFYLPTTLSLMNYMSMSRRDPGGVFRFIGAMAASTLATDSLLACSTMVADALAGDDEPVDVEGTLRWLGELVSETIDRRYGPPALEQFAEGVLEYGALLDAHHLDLVTQLRWIDADEMYALKAQKLKNAISEHKIDVELDTFVESSEECSTAHVHDDVRLVVIESGNMEFWNCFGEMHKFGPGDAMYVPMHRLHGSVVTSGTCVYHQPVITPAIDRVYG